MIDELLYYWHAICYLIYPMNNIIKNILILCAFLWSVPASLQAQSRATVGRDCDREIFVYMDASQSMYNTGSSEMRMGKALSILSNIISDSRIVEDGSVLHLQRFLKRPADFNTLPAQDRISSTSRAAIVTQIENLLRQSTPGDTENLTVDCRAESNSITNYCYPDFEVFFKAVHQDILRSNANPKKPTFVLIISDFLNETYGENSVSRDLNKRELISFLRSNLDYYTKNNVTFILSDTDPLPNKTKILEDVLSIQPVMREVDFTAGVNQIKNEIEKNLYTLPEITPKASVKEGKVMVDFVVEGTSCYPLENLIFTVAPVKTSSNELLTLSSESRPVANVNPERQTVSVVLEEASAYWDIVPRIENEQFSIDWRASFEYGGEKRPMQGNFQTPYFNKEDFYFIAARLERFKYYDHTDGELWPKDKLAVDLDVKGFQERNYDNRTKITINGRGYNNVSFLSSDDLSLTRNVLDSGKLKFVLEVPPEVYEGLQNVDSLNIRIAPAAGTIEVVVDTQGKGAEPRGWWLRIQAWFVIVLSVLLTFVLARLRWKTTRKWSNIMVGVLLTLSPVALDLGYQYFIGSSATIPVIMSIVLLSFLIFSISHFALFWILTQQKQYWEKHPAESPSIMEEKGYYKNRKAIKSNYRLIIGFLSLLISTLIVTQVML